MTILFGPESFTGSDGSAWPGTWTLGQNPSAGGGCTIQSNQGQISTGNHGGYSGLDRISRRANFAATADTETVTSFVFPDATECYPHISARETSTNIDGGTCYSLDCGPGNNINLYKSVAFASTKLATAAVTITQGVQYTVRFRVVGTTIQARFWQSASSEPNTWDISVTDSTISAAGYNGVAVSGGSAAVSGNWRIDDFTIADAAGVPGAGGGGGGSTGPTFVRLPDDTGSAFVTDKYQSLVLAVRPHETAATATPTKFGTCFIYHYDANGVLIDEHVIRFTGDNANALDSGFLCYPLIQVPCIGVYAVVFLIFDTPGLNELVSLTGSYRQISSPRVFNGGAYFGTSTHGSIGGGGVDGLSNWSVTVPASTTYSEYPYCWNGPGLLTAEIQGALTGSGADVYLADGVTGVILAGQRTITCAAATVLQWPVNVPAGPVKFVVKNNTAGAIPNIVVNLSTALSQ